MSRPVADVIPSPSSAQCVEPHPPQAGASWEPVENTLPEDVSCPGANHREGVKGIELENNGTRREKRENETEHADRQPWEARSEMECRLLQILIICPLSRLLLLEDKMEDTHYVSLKQDLQRQIETDSDSSFQTS
ncbi:unnamed protein product [Pleuronectes platessa]|uniref:Uncharacterized protein n=1 Tax=Pleuronectes platessa TaxID=8262 RepID=A0A9N7TQH6_PLEPL|nr:unnamed protein product [Pleuronectes platessa]